MSRKSSVQFLFRKLNTIKTSAPGFLSAISSGYLLMGANIILQFLLTPFYLKYFGKAEFGLLMMLLSLINFAAIGITWMSGGLVRVIGEYWADNDKLGLQRSFAVGKYVFTGYALLVLGLIFLISYAGAEAEIILDMSPTTILLPGIYFILLYESAPERQAFVGANKQSAGNLIELFRTLVFAVVIWHAVPEFQTVDAVWGAMIIGLVIQRIVSGFYWKKYVGGTGWSTISTDMRPLIKRLAGRQGVGYFSYGALLLISKADVVIVGVLGGAESAAQFVLLWKIPEAIGLVLSRIPASIEPRIIQLDALNKHVQLKTLYYSGRSWFMVLVLLSALGYALFGKWATELWVGVNAPEAQWMYTASGMALFFNSISRWPVAFAHALIKLRVLVKVTLVEVCSKIVLTAFLFSNLGIAAPIVATVIIHVVYISLAYQKMVFTRGK